MRAMRAVAWGAAVWGLFACGGDAGGGAPTGDVVDAGAETKGEDDVEGGGDAAADTSGDTQGDAADTGKTLSIVTEPFTIASGTEQYLCMTHTLDRDVRVERFRYEGVEVVHHLFFARAMAPEPAEPYECPVLFKTSWLPLFTTGAGSAELAMPADAPFVLPKGTQIVIQLHLLNFLPEDATRQVEVVMDLTDAEPEHEAVLFPMGTTVIDVPAQGSATTSQDCVLHRDLEIFAAFPHMHLLGTRMRLEAGPDADSMQTVYEREWDFDQQDIEPFELALPKGTHTRVVCEFVNDTDVPAGYGESTHDEMCFLSFFVKGGAALDGKCLDLSGMEGEEDPGEDLSGCKDVTANDKGIGAPCTQGGGECGSDLTCSSDMSDQGGTSGFCMSIAACATSADCGTGATCCAPPEGGGFIKVCLPDPCKPSSCEAVD